MRKFVNYLCCLSFSVVVLSGMADSEVVKKSHDVTCCPDVSTISVSPGVVCTGDILSFEADVGDGSGECSELEQDGFTWTWTCYSGCTISSVNDDEAEIEVTGAVGTDIVFRVKAVSSSCTPATPKSKKFEIPITSICGTD